ECIQGFSDTVYETVKFLHSRFPRIRSVVSKFESENPDKEKDLKLYLDKGEPISINLFLIKKGARIQPKNPGAKSFLTKYFISRELQDIFNQKYDEYYLEFLKDLLSHNKGTHYLSDRRELKKLIDIYYPKFT